MQNLVFIEPNKTTAEPFTTSDIIAESAKVKRTSVDRLIREHENTLKQFGIVGFEIRKLSGAGRPETVYRLNEEQATLLITFLKNTEPVVKFKTALVHEFYSMRRELQRREILREQLKPVRHDMTDEIQIHMPNNKWMYKQLTDLAYKSVLGKNAAQIRKERGAKPHDTAMDYMTADEIARISKAQNQIAVFVSIGMDYKQIKAVMIDKLLITNLAAMA